MAPRIKHIGHGILTDIEEPTLHAERERVSHHNALVATHEEAMAMLEGLVDRRHGGFNDVVRKLAEIAESKSGHVRHAWQDEIAAARYDQLAMKLEDFAETINLI